MRSFYRCGAALLAVLALFAACACQKTPPDYFAYQKRGFEAEVSGLLYGEQIAARITLFPDGERLVTYLFPPALSGISVGVRRGQGGEELAFASLDGIEVQSDPTLLAGWLTPVSAFVGGEEELASVRRLSEGYGLRLADGASLRLNASGVPTGATGEHYSFCIVRWAFFP